MSEEEAIKFLYATSLKLLFQIKHMFKMTLMAAMSKTKMTWVKIRV